MLRRYRSFEGKTLLEVWQCVDKHLEDNYPNPNDWEILIGAAHTEYRKGKVILHVLFEENCWLGEEVVKQ